MKLLLRERGCSLPNKDPEFPQEVLEGIFKKHLGPESICARSVKDFDLPSTCPGKDPFIVAYYSTKYELLCREVWQNIKTEVVLQGLKKISSDMAAFDAHKTLTGELDVLFNQNHKSPIATLYKKRVGETVVSFPWISEKVARSYGAQPAHTGGAILTKEQLHQLLLHVGDFLPPQWANRRRMAVIHENPQNGTQRSLSSLDLSEFIQNAPALREKLDERFYRFASGRQEFFRRKVAETSGMIDFCVKRELHAHDGTTGAIELCSGAGDVSHVLARMAIPT